LISINARAALWAHLRAMHPHHSAHDHSAPDHSAYVWHLAAGLVASHGDTAPDAAIAEVEALLRRDEIAAARIWRDVMHACRALLASASPAGPN